MKKIVAYTIHESRGNKVVSVIYNTVDDRGEMTGMNNRTDIQIGEQETISAIETIENYIKNAMGEK